MSNDWNLQVFQHNLEVRKKQSPPSSGLVFHRPVRRMSSSNRPPKPIAVISESSEIIFVQVQSIKKEVMVILQEVEQVKVRKVIKAVKEQITKYLFPQLLTIFDYISLTLPLPCQIGRS